MAYPYAYYFSTHTGTCTNPLLYTVPENDHVPVTLVTAAVKMLRYTPAAFNGIGFCGRHQLGFLRR